MSPPELVILIGLPAAGKTSFYRARFAATHAHVSKDLMRNRRDRQARQLALIDDALAAGRSVVVDNLNATIADRAAVIDVGRRHGAVVVGYLLDSSRQECLARNSARTGKEHVPAVAVHTAAKRFQPPGYEEGFDRLYRIDSSGADPTRPLRVDDFRVIDLPPAQPFGLDTIFLLSPASTSGRRAALLFNDRATFPLAQQIRSESGAPLGEVFSFLSSLYFRGKLAYAQAFARPPRGLCGAFVITPGEGLRDPAEPISLARLERYTQVPIRPGERRYLTPLLRDASALAILGGEQCRIVLLGSIASARYVEPLLQVFGDRLLYPPAFIGRGDMSRGGLLLRCIDDRRELDYAPLTNAVRHGPRPPRLPKRRPRWSADP